MADIEFDELGNPSPYQLIDMAIEDFHMRFVKGFKDSSTRRDVYKGYLSYVSDFYNEIVNQWVQWIDGSFITNKSNPNDIDLVGFVDGGALSDRYSEINKFLTEHGSNDRYKVDGYYVPVYAETDERHKIVTHKYMEYWAKWFGQDMETNPKGIVELNYNAETIDRLRKTVEG
ncbi:MAG: hypothetical protein L7F77_14675 [Candidatus Magnetominusculus sp. LBB02]|nr:hypothetical protein [Candidatus Magnetominusculus sp. LBB02]